jgi:uncharacterized protein (TIGR01777 family)
MRVLVTGGTGFIGERLVRALAERGDTVTVLSRRAGQSKHATQVVWTPEASGPWLDEVKSTDAIVHLAGAGILDKRWTPEHLAMCRSSRVVPTRLIAEAIAKRDDKPVFVSASAVGYYGFLTDDRVCDESAPAGTDVLAQMCAAWEASCAPAEDAGARVVRARVGVVLGPEGGAIAQMLPVFRLGLGGPLGNGKQMFPWIHVDDVVRALLFALDTQALCGPVNVTTPRPVTMTAFAKELGRVLGRPAFFKVPAFALHLAVGKGADVVLTGQNAVPKTLLGAGFSFRYPDLFDALADACKTGASKNLRGS